jgi:hypothetical protein
VLFLFSWCPWFFCWPALLSVLSPCGGSLPFLVPSSSSSTFPFPSPSTGSHVSPLNVFSSSSLPFFFSAPPFSLFFLLPFSFPSALLFAALLEIVFFLSFQLAFFTRASVRFDFSSSRRCYGAVFSVVVWPFPSFVIGPPLPGLCTRPCCRSDPISRRECFYLLFLSFFFPAFYPTLGLMFGFALPFLTPISHCSLFLTACL